MRANLVGFLVILGGLWGLYALGFPPVEGLAEAVRVSFETLLGQHG